MDEDDNGKFRFARVNCDLSANMTTEYKAGLIGYHRILLLFLLFQWPTMCAHPGSSASHYLMEKSNGTH